MNQTVWLLWTTREEYLFPLPTEVGFLELNESLSISTFSENERILITWQYVTLMLMRLCIDVCLFHYTDVIMGTIASQITSLTIVYSTVYSDADQRKYQSSASLAFVRGVHRRPVNSPHNWPVTRKMFPFDDVIMWDTRCNAAAPVSNLKLQINRDA